MKKLFCLLLISCLWISTNTMIQAKEESEDEIILNYHTLDDTKNINHTINNHKTSITYDLPTSYDSRDFNYLSSVKRQYSFGNCWAFAAAACAETSLIKKGICNQNIDLSEFQLVYHFYNRLNDPLSLTGNDDIQTVSEPYYDNGGNNYLTDSYLSTWGAYVLESEAPYPTKKSEIYQVDNHLNYQANYKVKNSVIIDESSEQEIKKALIEYGALSVSYYATNNDPTYCYTANASYSNHAVTLVGYDDTISRSLFSPNTPSRNGAWIIKNSWGASNGENGYYYLSYDMPLDTITAYDLTINDTYDYNYFYDGSCGVSYLYGEDLKVANIFKAQQNQEYLDAINIGIASSNTDYEIQIYKNLSSLSKPESGTPMLSTPQKGSKILAGYYTIDLKERITLKKNETFSVVVKLKSRDDDGASIFVSTSDNYGWIEMDEYTSANQSFYSLDGSSYTDLHNTNRVARIKAYTSSESSSNKTKLTSNHITLENDFFKYENQIITPKVTVMVSNQTLIDGVDYSVEYRNNDVEGTAYACIRGLNNYDGYVEVPFTISSTTYQEIVTNYEGAYDGKEHTFELKGYPSGSKVTYLVNGSSNWTHIKPTFIDAGEYTIKYRIQNEHFLYDHYGDAIVKINKANMNIVVEDQTYTYDGNPHQLVFDVPQGSTIQYRSNTNELYRTDPITLTNPGTITIYYQISHKNYKTYEGSATLTVFDINQRTIEVEINDQNAGTIEGSGVYYLDSEVTLKATAHYGYTFSHWELDGTKISTDTTYRFIVSDHIKLQAIFNRNQYTIDVTYDENQLSIDGANTYYYNDQVTLKATAKYGYQFDGWYENDNLISSNATYTFKANNHRSLQAKSSIRKIPRYSVKLTSNKDVNLYGANTYDENTYVSVSTSSKSDKYQFVGWFHHNQLVSLNPTYSFYIDKDYELYAKYELIIPFYDLYQSDWYYQIVINAYESDLMSGTTYNTFEPETPTTRGMVATILYRMAKYPSSNFKASFPDVKQNLWYSNAINWASSLKIVNGYQNGNFGPDDNVTREQLAIMIYNYAVKMSDVDTNIYTSIDHYVDAHKVNTYAKKAMTWMIEHGIISGKKIDGQSYLDPHAKATRAECAKMLYLAQQIFSK